MGEHGGCGEIGGERFQTVGEAVGAGTGELTRTEPRGEKALPKGSIGQWLREKRLDRFGLVESDQVNLVGLTELN